MKERIKEFAKEAQAYADQQWLEVGYPSWENYHEVFAEDYNKKFAELIVKETMQVVANNLPQNTYIDVADAVIEHFGVKS